MHHVCLVPGDVLRVSCVFRVFVVFHLYLGIVYISYWKTRELMELFPIVGYGNSPAMNTCVHNYL